jgi:sRNA-binding regulator protein Hfq
MQELIFHLSSREGTEMGYLENLSEYLAKNYDVSVFDTSMASGKPWELHLHGHRTIVAAVLENRKWDITVDVIGREKEEIQKIQVKYLYPADAGETIKPLFKMDKTVEALELEPIFNPRKRYFVKNKSLYPLMKEKEVVLFTLIEGEVLRGIITDFSRYDVTLSLKGGLPVTILRHSIYDVRNKRGRCFLKTFQEEHRDWEKSPLYVS